MIHAIKMLGKSGEVFDVLEMPVPTESWIILIVSRKDTSREQNFGNIDIQTWWWSSVCLILSPLSFYGELSRL